MKTFMFIISILMLANLYGCQTTKLVPVYTMPTAPAELLVPLPPLQQLQSPAPTGKSNE